jgi:lysophospholipase L1-like esterase
MKRILCFGDSLTWGYDPDKGTRLAPGDRWTGVLAALLGEGYTVIEEGQNGRTIATDDPAEGEKNGIRYIVPCLESQRPLDIMILMLGTNDLKRKFSYAASDIAGEMEQFLQKVLSYNRFKMEDQMKILLISPPVVGEKIRDSVFGDSFGYENAVEVSRKLDPWYRGLADKYGLAFLDASEVVKVSDSDSIHLDAVNQRKLAGAIYDRLSSERMI